jgi:3-hydroxyacyl-CoA dehydrogenase
MTGRLGKKSGRGFYTYRDGRRKGPDDHLREELGLADRTEEESIFDERYLVSRCLYPMVNEAARALDEGIVESPADGDLALVMGMGWPPFRGGLLRWADETGVARVVERLDEWATAVDPRFTPLLAAIGFGMGLVYAIGHRMARVWPASLLRLLAVSGFVLPAWTVFRWYQILTGMRDAAAVLPIDQRPVTQRFVASSAVLLTLGFVLLVTGIFLARRLPGGHTGGERIP